MKRRRFIVKAGGVLAAGATAVVDAPHVIAQPKVQWRMSTTWPATLDVLQGSAERLGKIVDEMSGGRFRIEVFPAGQIMPPFECFDAASKGTDIQAFMAAPFYWAARDPAIQWFHTVPFGMNPEGMAAWLYQGDGLKLMEEAYGAFNLVPRPAMAQGPQMAGWFRRKMTTIADYKGLKMRVGPFGGKVYVKAGSTPVLTPADEIYAALERGVIDACEWVGPHDDMKLGLHRTAPYYCYPGWHETGSMNEFAFNKKAYEALPIDLRRMLDHASAAINVYGFTESRRRTRSPSRSSRPSSKERCRSSRFRCQWSAISRGSRPRRSRGVGEEPDGQEGARVLHQVPGPARRLGPHLRRRLPPVRGAVMKTPIGSGTATVLSHEAEGRHMKRRRFIVKAGGVLAAAGAAAVVDAPDVIAQPKVQWRMSTAWTAALDILQGGALRLAKIVEETTAGRFRIEVFPGGQIMPPLDCFDATAKGTVEAFMGSPQYWSAKEPAIEWFATIPFGMDPQGMAAWYYQGDGLKLMEEAYAAFDLVPRPAMSNAPQMAGWFRKRINAIGDFKGLKMRIVNLGGKVYARAGATTVLTPGNEIYAALERGVIDTAEWIGPHSDMQIGLHQTARYYYYPGWHEPGTTLDFGFNRKAYEALPVDLRRTLDHAAAAVQVYGSTEYRAKDAIALQRLRTEFKEKVEILPLPVPVLRDLKKLAATVVKEESEKTPMARKVHASFTKFQVQLAGWARISEGAYHQLVAG